MVLVRTKALDPAVLPLIYATLVSMLNMIFGFEIGILFGNQSEFVEFFVEAANRTQVLIGGFVLGFIFGVFIAGYISYGTGRKITLLSSAVLGTLAVISSNVAPNFTVMMCSYFVIGFSFGLYLLPSMLYICEVVLPANRAFAMMLLPFFFFLGMEFSLFSPSIRSIETIVFYVIFVLLNIIVISIALVKLPESPRFLALSGSTDAALSVLFKLRRDMGMAARELAEINECCRGESRGIELYLQNTVCRRMLTFLCICILLFSITGATIVPYMLVDFLNYQLQCDDNNLCEFTTNRYLLALGFTSLLLTVIWHIFAFSRYTKRSLLIVETMIGSGFLFLTTLGCVLPVSSLQNWLVLIALLGVIFVFSGCFIAFISVMSVELLPIRGREFGMTALCISFGIGCLLSLQMFKPAVNFLTIYGFFLGSSLLASFLSYLIYALMPMTESLSLEEIEGQIMSVQNFSDLSSIQHTEKLQRMTAQSEVNGSIVHEGYVHSSTAYRDSSR